MSMPSGQFPHGETSSPLPPEGPSDDATKYTKEEANYRAAGSSQTTCGSCAHYQGGGVCEVVAGTVSPEGGVSDLYKPRTSGLMDLVTGAQ